MKQKAKQAVRLLPPLECETIPITDPGEIAALERRISQRATGAPVRPILIVEDDAATREFIAEMLVAKGYTVSAAADGAQARALVEAYTGGAQRYDGRMIEAMHVAEAKTIIERYERLRGTEGG